MTPARPTIGDVAAAAGVSVATVSRALRGLDNVSADTRAKVEAAAKKLDYTVDSRASSLASGRTSTVGLVAPFFDSWYASQIIASLSERLAGASYDLLVYSVDRSVENRLDEVRTRFRGRRIDGLVLIDLWMSPEEVEVLGSLRVPVVTIGDRTELASSVTVDDHSAGLALARHLLELGHRSFLFVGGARPGEIVSPPARDREAALRSAVAEAGLPQGAVCSVDGEFSIEGGQRAFAEVADSGALPTAVVCASDEMALGVMAEAWQRNWTVPERMSVVGFDGHEMSPMFGLTTVDQHVRNKGILAADLLLDLMSADPGATDCARLETDVELVVRTSTGVPAV